MIRHYLIISILLVACSITAFSQHDWRQGYIIKNSGDTIYGQIDYRSPISNSQYCYFRENEQDNYCKYSPNEIAGYRYINDKFYTAKSVKINEIERVVFLEFLIKGRANVYFLKDENEKYFIEKDKQIYELKNSGKTIYRDGNNYISEQREYIGVMNYLLQEAQIIADINNTKLDHNSLIETAKKYHNKVCTDEECVVYQKKMKPVKVDFGLVYGKHNKMLQLSKNQQYNLNDNFSNYFGLAFNFRNLPGIYERFSLQIELLASEYSFENKQRYQLNIPLLLDYRITSSKFYPKIELGASMYFAKNDQIKAQHISLMAGLSFHYEFYKDYRIFINTRLENSPGIFRFGGGLVF